jgi:phosphoglycerate dehydrogenase-like enzyme
MLLGCFYAFSIISIQQTSRFVTKSGNVRLIAESNSWVTVGIIGYGNMGSSVAKRLSGFGVKVLIRNTKEF